MWKELARIALLGTNRASLSPKVLDALKAKGVNVEQDMTKILLEGAAVWSQMKQAGFPLKPFKGDMPMTAHLADLAPPASPKAAQYLKKILEGDKAPALLEFLSTMKRQKKRIPQELLPLFFQFFQKSPPSLQHQLLPFIDDACLFYLEQVPELDIDLSMIWMPESLGKYFDDWIALRAENLAESWNYFKNLLKGSQANLLGNWLYAVEAEWTAEDQQHLHDLFTFWKENKAEYYWKNGSLPFIFSKLTNEFWNKQATLLLSEKRGPIDGQQTIWQLLLHSPQAWNASLTKQFTHRLLDFLPLPYTQDWQESRQILQQAMYQADTEMHDYMKSVWMMNKDISHFWDKDVTVFLQTMRFRREMKKEMTTNN